MTPTAHPHAVVNEVMWHKPQFSPCFPFNGKWIHSRQHCAVCIFYKREMLNIFVNSETGEMEGIRRGLLIWISIVSVNLDTSPFLQL